MDYVSLRKVADHSKSRSEWNQMRLETLSKKCAQYDISSSSNKKPELIDGLLQHFGRDRMEDGGSAKEQPLLNQLRSLTLICSDVRARQETLEKHLKKSDQTKPQKSTLKATDNEKSNSDSISAFTIPSTGSSDVFYPSVPHEASHHTTTPRNELENPFTLPPLNSEVLKRIENLEYIEFDQLLPENYKKRDSICDFSRWQFAWNRYMQATLHYHIRLFHDLFCYQQIISVVATQHTFHACYAYDQDFRSLIASQMMTNESKKRTTAKWSEIHELLYSKHFSADTLFPPCAKCHIVGHRADSCQSSTSENLTSQVTSQSGNETHNETENGSNGSFKGNQGRDKKQKSPKNGAWIPHQGSWRSNSTKSKSKRKIFTQPGRSFFRRSSKRSSSRAVPLTDANKKTLEQLCVFINGVVL